jgi:hypothetical protein
VPESIPDDAVLSRLVFFPRMRLSEEKLLWKAVFEFPTNKETGRPHRESVVWNKYAPTYNDVHRIGCEIQSVIRTRRPEAEYRGLIKAIAGSVRAARTVRGHGFIVEHAPEEGLHHAEVGIDPAPNTQILPADKEELRLALEKIFSALFPHSCAA